MRRRKDSKSPPSYTARASPRGGRVALFCPSGACGALGKAAHEGRSFFLWVAVAEATSHEQLETRPSWLHTQGSSQ